MSPDIEAVHRLLLDQKASSKKLFSARAPRGMSLNVLIFSTQVWNVAKPYIEKYQTEYIPESRPVSPTAFSLDSPASPRKRVRHEWKHTQNKFFFFFWQLLQSQKNKDPTQWSWSTPQLVKSVWPLSETNWSRMGETDPYASLWHFTDKSGVQALSFLHLSLLDLWIFYSH